MNPYDDWLVADREECVAVVCNILCRTVRSRQKAADLACDAVSFAHGQVYAKARQLNDRRHCRNWVIRVAVNYTIQKLRTESRRQQKLAELHAAARDGTGPWGHAPSPFQSLLADLREALERLPAEDRELIERRYLHEMGLEELRQLLDLGSVSTVHKRIHRILGQLRALLDLPEEVSPRQPPREP